MPDLWTPLYHHSGDLFVYISTGFAAPDEPRAVFIGMTAQARGEFTGQALHLTGQQPHVRAKLGGIPVAILSGPTFTRAAARSRAAATA